MIYDAKCTKCEHIYEERRHWSDPVTPCPECGGEGATIWLTVPSVDRAKDPYDLLDGKGQNPGKKIVSGPKYSSKTTV